jgi:hypothetical protein
LVQDTLNLYGLGDPRRRGKGFLMVALFRDDIIAKVNAFIANVNRRSCDELADLILTLSTERANKITRAIVAVLWHRAPSSPLLIDMLTIHHDLVN